MDNTLNINEKVTLANVSKEYFVTLDGKPVCAPQNDEPGVFDNIVMKIYDAFVVPYGQQRVKIVCVTTYNPVLSESSSEE